MQNPNFKTKTRFLIFIIFIFIVFGIFVLRLIQLQLLEGGLYQLASESQAIKRIIEEPFRGNIYDANNKMIVHNEASFSLTLTPNLYFKESGPLLASILDTNNTYIDSLFNVYSKYSIYKPVKFLRDLSFEKVARIEEYADYLRGMEIVVESKRFYEKNSNMAHILGYTAEVSKNELKRLPYLKMGDIIGKNGIENEYDNLLRGREGYKFVTINKFGQQVSSYDNGKQDRGSKNGFDLYLSIDDELQKVAEQALLGKRGAVVAMNPTNGEILALASSPFFELDKFSGSISKDYYSQLMNDKGLPFLDRTVNSQYPPGSSWKMLVALIGLEKGIINKNSTLKCVGGHQYGNRFYKCMGHHGDIDVTRAIKQSCNAFFYQLSLKLKSKNLVNFGRIMGFGQKTNIDLPSEKSGNFPSLEELNKRYNNDIPGWKLMNYAIGQGEITVTPVQMATYISSIANRGTLYQPHLVRSIYNNLSDKFEPISYDAVDLGIDKSHFDIVIQGMSEVVNSEGGTGWRARIPGYEVCGKTSTAQNPHGKDHGWFTCFAPKDNPQITVVVIVENAGSGGLIAAPIAKEVLLKHFYPNGLPKPKTDSTSIDSLIISEM